MWSGHDRGAGSIGLSKTGRAMSAVKERVGMGHIRMLNKDSSPTLSGVESDLVLSRVISSNCVWDM